MKEKMSLQDATLNALLSESSVKINEVKEDDKYHYYEIYFDFSNGRGTDGYSVYFKSLKDIGEEEIPDVDDIDDIVALGEEAGALDDDNLADIDYIVYAQQISKEHYQEAVGKETESKKIEEAKLNFLPVSELPDICYGLLPSDNSIIIIKKGENGYYETDYDIPESHEEAEKLVNKLNSEIDITPDQRFTMELRSLSGNWSDKKTESNSKMSYEDWKNSDLYIPALLKYYDVDTEEELADCNISENDVINIYNEYASSKANAKYNYYEIHFDFTEESGKDSAGYSKFFKSTENVEDDTDEIWNLAIMEDVIGDEDDYYDVDYAQKIDKGEYEDATREKVESKKVESIQRDFKSEFNALSKAEQKKYKKCISPINRTLSDVEVATMAKECGLDSDLLRWVVDNIKKEESKKVEDKEDITTDLEKAFTTEVRYWLEALVGEKSNDEIGKKATSVLEDDSKVKEIVDELVNGSDDLWEDIHMRIEQLAGIDYRNSTRA